MLLCKLLPQRSHKICPLDFFSFLTFSSVSSVVQTCLTLCDPMNRSTPGLPVHHQLPEFTQTHVHRVSDAIQPSHPLLSSSPPAPNPSQHQSFSNESTLCMRTDTLYLFSSGSPSTEISIFVYLRMFSFLLHLKTF